MQSQAMKSVGKIHIVLLFVVFALARNACADSVADPDSYIIVSSNHKYVFVMLSPLSVEAEAALWNEKKANEVQAIRKKYKQSGLYLNDGSTNPLWTVDWYGSVVPYSDGVHLIRIGPPASTSQQEAISFFANGRLLKSYKIRELVDFPLLTHYTESHLTWRSDTSLDDRNKRYHLRTVLGESYTFDITTGQMVSSFRLPRWILAALLIALAWW